ncbi:hypothetical protein [Rhodococcus marinonascens]|nr:hypothetical protein [Rhodococcus marinonascens]
MAVLRSIRRRRSRRGYTYPPLLDVRADRVNYDKQLANTPAFAN